MKSKRESAKKILEVVPFSMARIRTLMRSSVPADLSVPNFRIMHNILKGRSLMGEIASHIGVSQPSLSRSIETLVKRGYVKRCGTPADRRKVPLKLTAKGESLLQEIIKGTEEKMILMLKDMDSNRLDRLLSGLSAIEEVFSEYQHGMERRKSNDNSKKNRF